MTTLMTTVDVPLRTVVDGIGYTNIFSPTTPVNPDGWLLLQQFKRNGPWHHIAFPLSSTTSALRWYLFTKAAIMRQTAGHGGVRLVFADGSLVAEHVQCSANKSGKRKVYVT
jgi:hypothetical protein